MNNESISLGNTKINVAAYAEQYGITLEHANKEIQDFLFLQGCFAYTPATRAAKAIYVGSDKVFTKVYPGEFDSFIYAAEKEVFIERNIVLTIKREADTISFDGKKYIKEEFLKAIQNLNVVDC